MRVERAREWTDVCAWSVHVSGGGARERRGQVCACGRAARCLRVAVSQCSLGECRLTPACSVDGRKRKLTKIVTSGGPGRRVAYR